MKKKYFLILVAPVLFICLTRAQSSELKEVAPATANVSETRLARIDKILQQGIDSGWIAGAVGFIARDGKIVSFQFW